MKQPHKSASFIAVLPMVFFSACTTEKPNTINDNKTPKTVTPLVTSGCQPPDCHMNPPPQSTSTPTSEPVKPPETKKPLISSGCQPPDCHMNPPPQTAPVKPK
jgi:hypothetical protein